MSKTKTTILSENFFRRFAEVFAPHLDKVGVDPGVLQKEDVEIPEELYAALFEAAGEVNPNVGLELGGQTNPEDIGAVGHAMASASTVQQMLDTYQRFIVVLSQRSWVNYEVRSNQLIIAYQAMIPTVVHRRQDSEFAMAFTLRLLQLCSGEPIQPIRVDFEHEKPEDISVHRAIFQCPIYFNQSINRLYLPANVLGLPAAHSNERLFQALLPYLEMQLEERNESPELQSRLVRLIAAELSGGVPSLADIGSQLGIGVRTLQRRLKKEDIEFSALISSVRQDLAIAYLSDPKYSITEISALVGYAETASFSRAFRRWTGVSPQEYRDTLSK